MSSAISAKAAGARESARQANGRFGVQEHAETATVAGLGPARADDAQPPGGGLAVDAERPGPGSDPGGRRDRDDCPEDEVLLRSATEAQRAQWQAQADELQARARSARQSASDSWERCDTDGFLSQWASGLTAQRLELQARITRLGGRDRFRALLDATTGELVAAKLVQTRFGSVWGLLSDPDDPHSPFRSWVSRSRAQDPAKRAATMRTKGYVEAWVLAPAKAELRGGPGGAVNVRAVSVRTDGGFSRDVEIVETDEG